MVVAHGDMHWLGSVGERGAPRGWVTRAMMGEVRELVGVGVEV